MVISAYIRRKEMRKPVTQVFLHLKDCTYKEGSKNVTQDKSVKLSKSLKTGNAINKLCRHPGACISPARKQIVHAIKKKKRALDFSRPGRLEHGQT